MSKSEKAKASINARWEKNGLGNEYERNTNVSENEYERNTTKSHILNDSILKDIILNDKKRKRGGGSGRERKPKFTTTTTT